MRCPRLSELPPPPPGKTGWPWTEESPQLPDLMPDGRLWPRISIVTPSYNQGVFLEETIRSVLLQGYPNVEYIIFDGYSFDHSVEVIKKYSEWLSLWVSEPDRGQTDAINKGFSKASGQIYGYLNSDDLYDSGILHAVANSFALSPEPNKHWVVSHVLDFCDQNKRLVIPPPDLELIHWVARRVSVHQPGTFWAAALYKEIKGFDENYKCAFDRKFFMEIIARGYMPQVLGRVGAYFRVHQASKTGLELERSPDGSIFVEEFIRISHEFMPRLRDEEQVAVRQYFRQQTMSRILRSINCGGRTGGKAILEFAFRSLGEFPSSIVTRFFWGAVRRLLW